MKKIALGAALLLLVLVAVWLASFVPNADWTGTYEAVGRGVFHGRSPYAQPLFVNPPWGALLVVPFAAFSSGVGRGLLLVASLAAWTYAGWRLHAPRIAFVAMLLSPTAISSLLAANLDAFVVLGLFLPPAAGLFLLMLKPQIGLGPALYDLVDRWQDGRFRSVLRTFGPIIIAYVLSAILFPVWVDRMLHKPANVWNRTLFPYGLPVGFLFLWLSLRTRNAFWALASSPFLAPYVTLPTYLVVQVGLLHEDVERYIRRDVLQIILSALLWVAMLTFKL